MGSLSVFVLYVLHSSSCLANIDRIITFKEPIPERVMEDHVLSSSRVQTEGSCRVNCYMEPNCVSINMRRLAGGAMICELNDVTTSDYFVLTTKSSHSYMEIENPCSSNPCMGKTRCQAGFTSKGFRCQPTPIDTNECNHSLCENGGTCKLKDGKHNCHCPRNFTGSSCEIHAQEIGCFTDKFYDRALLFLESYRGRIPWNNLWKVVRDCSKAAKKLKYYYFAIQGYGDCWAGLANQTYDKHGHSDNCHSRPGLGGQLTNFVYKFTDV
ncbi:PREDICTED: neurogenic locus Notch protein-like isoform X5 [Acropora digitifera]|uniref:neurogenic locus Notch protein-like isoform X5 n=1 Tax=Acropora digitifera TaxID=70779 RepID=UPI00077B225B|nr:PREDICTED: neurogenic locus Notch protein-like isoform X5 [Acropora digitifera]